MQFPINGIISRRNYFIRAQSIIIVRLLLACHYMVIIKLSNILLNFSIAVDDASGHYTTGLFFGNNFWIGSLSSCRAIYKEPAHLPVISKGKFDNSHYY